MKKHVKNYLNHFDLVEQDFIYCEYEYIVNGAMVRAVDVHHIIYRSHGGSDEIDNNIALSRKPHDKAHNEQISKDRLKEIHIEFLQTNPY